MLKCKVCGCKFKATKKRHYIAQDPAIINAPLYDAFDCPLCGTQIIVGERKYRNRYENDKKEKKDVRID